MNFSRLTFSAFILCLMFAVTGNSQAVNKGAWMIGGNIGFSSVSVKDSDISVNTFNFSPSVGYFVVDNLGIGLGVDYLSISIDGESDSFTYLTPAVRYYVYDALFAQVSYQLGLTDGLENTLRIGAGYSWFLNNSVAIEPQVYYSLISDEDVDAAEFGLAIGVRAFIGRN